MKNLKFTSFKSKAFLLVVCFFLLNSMTYLNAQCPSNNLIKLETQAEVDAFVAAYPNCTSLNALTLGRVSFSNPSDITDLSGFSNITSIKSLRIWFCPLLENLNGLQNISSVNNLLEITNNAALKNLDGLQGLTSLGNFCFFSIRNNASLENINGLSNLNSIFLFQIISNPSLTNLNGLENLTTIKRQLQIGNNSSLVDLSALQNLISINGFLFISNHSSLTNLNGLENLTSAKAIWIEKNEVLNDIDAIKNIEPNSLQSFSSDPTFKALKIEKNPNLSSCAIAPVCDYLALAIPDNYVSISENAPGCMTRTEIKNDCCPEPTFYLSPIETTIYCWEAETFLPEIATYTNNEVGYCNTTMTIEPEMQSFWNKCDGGYIYLKYKTQFGAQTIGEDHLINVMADTYAPNGDPTTMETTVPQISEIPSPDNLQDYKDYIASFYSDACSEIFVTVIGDTGQPECSVEGNFERTYTFEVSDVCGNIVDQSSTVKFRGNCNPLYCTLSQEFYSGTANDNALFGMTSIEITETLLGGNAEPILIGSTECGLAIDEVECIQALLQGSGQSNSLPSGFSLDCDSPLDNVLVNQVITTILNIRYNELLNPNGSLDFGSFHLAASCMNIPGYILDALPPSPTVNDLINYANDYISCQCSGTCGQYQDVMADLAGLFLGLNSRFLNCNDVGPINCADNEDFVDNNSDGVFQVTNKTNPIELFDIAPNPAQDEVTINFSNKDLESTTILIYNNMGQLVFENTVTDNSLKIDISDSKFNSGLYLVNIKLGTANRAKRLMIIK